MKHACPDTRKVSLYIFNEWKKQLNKLQGKGTKEIKSLEDFEETFILESNNSDDPYEGKKRKKPPLIHTSAEIDLAIARSKLQQCLKTKIGQDEKKYSIPTDTAVTYKKSDIIRNVINLTSAVNLDDGKEVVEVKNRLMDYIKALESESKGFLQFFNIKGCRVTKALRQIDKAMLKVLEERKINKAAVVEIPKEYRAGEASVNPSPISPLMI